MDGLLCSAMKAVKFTEGKEGTIHNDVEKGFIYNVYTHKVKQQLIYLNYN